MLEIFEEELPQPNSSSFSFVVRKKNTVDDRITSERLLDEEQIKSLMGDENIDISKNKNKIVEMLARYASHNNLD